MSAANRGPTNAASAPGASRRGFICKEQDMTLRSGQRTVGWLLVAAGAALNTQTLIDWMRHSVV